MQKSTCELIIFRWCSYQATSKKFIFWLVQSLAVWLICSLNYFPYHPWDWYIYLHEWLIFMVNVGRYTSPMDAMAFDLSVWPNMTFLSDPHFQDHLIFVRHLWLVFFNKWQHPFLPQEPLPEEKIWSNDMTDRKPLTGLDSYIKLFPSYHMYTL